jgi:P4 family phage/plasmid primase-like protien
MHRNKFAFKNKIIDVQKNEFIEPNPEDYINMTCGYDYDDNYNEDYVREFDEILDTLFVNKEIKNIYLSLLSTGLDGKTLEKFTVANGSGGNGKGLLNETALETVGDYGYVLPATVLTTDIKTGSNPELANLQHKRLVLVREPKQGSTWNSNALNELTGGDEICARHNYSNETKTTLHLTLIAECNQKPKLPQAWKAMERRILDIPFESEFLSQDKYNSLDEEIIKNGKIFKINTNYKSSDFKQKYKQALFELLRPYCKAFYDNSSDIKIPSIIDKRNKAYMSSSDDICNFFEDNFEKTNNVKDIIKVKLVFEEYKKTDYFLTLSKEEKRACNYKTFVETLESNVFVRLFIGVDRHQTKIIKCFKFKPDTDDANENYSRNMFIDKDVEEINDSIDNNEETVDKKKGKSKKQRSTEDNEDNEATLNCN